MRQGILDAEAGARRSSQQLKQVMISEAVVRENSKEICTIIEALEFVKTQDARIGHTVRKPSS